MTADYNNQIVYQLEYNDGANLYRAQKFDWFFYTPSNSSWDCVAGSCVDSGTGMGLYTDSLQCVLNCQTTAITNEKDPTTVRLIKITDILGRETLPTKNIPLFYFYSDGTVTRRMIVH